MVSETILCVHYGSDRLRRDGLAYNGKQKYFCNACKRGSRQNPKARGYSQDFQTQVLAVYHERASLRGVCRIFGISRQTLITWLKKAVNLPPLKTTLAKAKHSDVLELDEMWSFVARRRNKRWIWLAQCRRTRQIVAYAIGSRSEETCRLLWQRLPKRYKRCLMYSDFWDAYQKVLLDEQHEAMGKGDGQTYHIERFNNILRQRLGRFVRRTLSFSKCALMHELCLRLFLHEHNKHCLR